ncbi:MAG: ATP-binding protein [Candidatus Helarchaeota archaeon]
MSDEVYDQIRRHMNNGWPLQLPKHKKVLDFLKILFPTEEEVRIISIFNEPMFEQKSVKKISKITKIPLEKVTEICEHMAKRGVILKVGKKYSLLPIMPGLFEFYFISRTDPEETMKKASKLFHELLDRGLLNEWYNSEYPFFRTLPISSLQDKMKKIDVNESIGVQHEILVYEDVESYLNMATSITIVNCACRTTSAYLGDKCDKPIDICFALNMASEALKPYGLGKRVTREEAFKLLKTAEDNGLVHTIINSSGSDSPMLICNCCTCHCGVLRGLTDFDNPRAFAKSNYRPEINQDLCKKCEKCMNICPMKAIWHHWPHEVDLKDDFMLIKENSCIGCGLCAHHCPTNAITMVKVYNDIPENTLPGVFKKIEETKQH